MVWTRQESLQARAKRHPYRMRYRTGALATGEVVAQQIELLADAGAYAYLSALVLLYSTVTAAGPYRVPAVRVGTRRLHQQPADQRDARLRRHADRVRLRVAD